MAKPHKVQEPAGIYGVAPRKQAKPLSQALKAGGSGVRYVDDATAGKLADKIFAERKNLLRKLAQ